MTANPHLILTAVSEFYGIAVPEMLGPRRFKSVTLARHVGFYLIHQHCRSSFTEMGVLGWRDRSTISLMVRNLIGRLAKDPQLAREVAYIEDRLKEIA